MPGRKLVIDRRLTLGLYHSELLGCYRHGSPRMYDNVLLCGRSPHFSAGNEIYFITIVPTPRNILSNNTNLLILYTKYILKIFAHRKYKELSKWENFV